MEIQPVRSLSTNYIWTIINQQQATVIDPGDVNPISVFLKSRNITCTNILITHHHPDHTGGVKALQAMFPRVNVYGPNLSMIGIDCQDVSQQETLIIPGFNQPWSIIPTPGHTLDHLCFQIEDKLFCGDTLFSIGCGKLFEGKAEHLFASLNRLMTLPEDTVVYPAHEYTLDNLSFALSIEPDNIDLKAYQKQVINKIQQKIPSLPTTIKQEKMLNPFVRCADPMLQTALKQRHPQPLKTPLETFAALRALKDNF